MENTHQKKIQVHWQTYWCGCEAGNLGADVHCCIEPSLTRQNFYRTMYTFSCKFSMSDSMPHPLFNSLNPVVRSSVSPSGRRLNYLLKQNNSIEDKWLYHLYHHQIPQFPPNYKSSFRCNLLEFPFTRKPLLGTWWTPGWLLSSLVSPWWPGCQL